MLVISYSSTHFTQCFWYRITSYSLYIYRIEYIESVLSERREKNIEVPSFAHYVCCNGLLPTIYVFFFFLLCRRRVAHLGLVTWRSFFFSRALFLSRPIDYKCWVIGYRKCFYPQNDRDWTHSCNGLMSLYVRSSITRILGHIGSLFMYCTPSS